jgi:hypothetical protein
MPVIEQAPSTTKKLENQMRKSQQFDTSNLNSMHSIGQLNRSIDSTKISTDLIQVKDHSRMSQKDFTSKKFYPKKHFSRHSSSHAFDQKTSL